MNATLDAFLRSWPTEPAIVLALLAFAGIYLRGWLALRRRDPRRWRPARLAAFCGGLFCLFLALASPIEPFAAILLQIHMVQHLLLMMAAPPLLWLGWPLFPLLRGLPAPIRQVWAIPILRSGWLRGTCHYLTHPGPALAIFAAVTLVWHAPAVYDLAVRNPGWHIVQHGCFLIAGFLFWYPVIVPYPARPRYSPWLVVPMLLVADVLTTALSALLAFSDRALYAYYAALPGLNGITPLDDQMTAGAIMWVPGSLVLLVPTMVIGLRLLYGTPAGGPSHRPGPLPIGRMSLPLVSAQAGFDLLRTPGLGRFLKWRHARTALQIPMLILAGLVVVDGLTGPQVGAMNLAGVLPWTHWRGLVVIGLLTAGNVFCMACPFVLPRTIARRWLPAPLHWPGWLRSKWLAVGLLAVFLWAYEAFSLWDSPCWTAWITLGYFAAALCVDGLFRGAAFCKYVCPIGQFHFVQSLVSPLEIAVRDEAVCRQCQTKDCIRGRDGIPGCELELYLPRKSGNMDCTACLDCVHACPHDNIAIKARPPGAELWHDPQRSGVGRFSQRLDLAVLVLVLVFGAFANAAGMAQPVVEWQERLAGSLEFSGKLFAVTAFYIGAIVLLPAAVVIAAGVLSWNWGRPKGGYLQAATAFVYALAPLGFAMWAAHYLFHFLTSYESAMPVAQRFVADWGGDLGPAAWAQACCMNVAGWLPRFEIVLLDCGLLASLYTCWRIALARSDRPVAAVVPWAMVIVGLFALGVWIVLQPMEMRGTIPM
jgi:cytochrome c oxidase assembly factor CtaG/ferredoxin